MPEPVQTQPTEAQPVATRLKAFLFPPAGESKPADTSADDSNSQTDNDGGVAPADVQPSPAETKAPLKPKQAKETPQAEVDETDADVQDDDDAQTEELQLSSLKDLTEATGLDLDKILDLEVPTKIDGKDGTARLRDLVRSYQLDEHINQKLASLDNDRKAFVAEREKTTRETADRLLRLDAGLKTLERSLMAEFSAVDWQKLQTEDPLAFNAQYVGYQQRYAALQDIAGQLNQEQQKAQSEQQAQFKTWAEEQKKLFAAKIPEWADETKRSKDRAEILEYLKGYGISNDEFAQVIDHRHALVIRDAWKWHQLQKAKPTTLNKVKAAPKLLRPGTQQSRVARGTLELKNAQERLRKTGKARDAAQVLKRLGVV